MEAHHCDQVAAGGARHAGNLLLLCNYHHLSFGDAVSRAEVVRSFHSMVDHVVAFQSGDGGNQIVSGSWSKFIPRSAKILFLSSSLWGHLEYWKTKASEERIS